MNISSYENYDILSEDPYLINGSCLVNNLGFKDTSSLNDAEEALTKITMAELVRSPVIPAWNLEHLKEIHRRIFEDIYPFAGKVRKTEIAKGDKLFLPYKQIEEKAYEIFGELTKENYFQGLAPQEFGLKAGFFMAQVNTIHPFREGNGRTQRILIDQLAKQAGNYIIEWTAISDRAMGDACREARAADPTAHKLSRLLMLNTKKLIEE